MTKLLRADFRRYVKNIIPWSGLLASLLCGAVSGLNTRICRYIDDIFILPFFVILTVVIALMIGTEHSDGAIRRKVAVGHTKGEIYLSQLCIAVAYTTAAALLYFGAFIPFMVGMRVPFPISALLLTLLGFWVISMAYAAMAVTIAASVSQKAISAVAAILLVMATVFVTYTVDDVLGQPDYIHIESVYPTGEVVVVEEANPRYVGEPWRTILEAVKKGNPYGSTICYTEIIDPFFWGNDAPTALTAEEERTMNTLPLYPLSIGLLFSLGGWLGFRKKELK